MSLTTLDTSYKWDYAVCILRLPYFIQYNVLHVHPCCHKGQCLLKAEYTPLYGYTTFSLSIQLSVDILVKEMATYSSILAWRMPGTEEPDGLQSMGSQRIGHDLETKQQSMDF